MVQLKLSRKPKLAEVLEILQRMTIEKRTFNALKSSPSSKEEFFDPLIRILHFKIGPSCL